MALTCPGCGKVVAAPVPLRDGALGCPTCSTPLDPLEPGPAPAPTAEAPTDHSPRPHAASGRPRRVTEWMEARQHRDESDAVHPALASLGSPRPRPHGRDQTEPWYYRVLVMYAQVILLLFFIALMSLIVFAFLLVENVSWFATLNDQPLAAHLAVILVAVGVAFFAVLFQVALILLLVDAARNLREINLRFARLAGPSEPDAPRL